MQCCPILCTCGDEVGSLLLPYQEILADKRREMREENAIKNAAEAGVPLNRLCDKIVYLYDDSLLVGKILDMLKIESECCRFQIMEIITREDIEK